MSAAPAAEHWAILGGTFDPIHIGHLRIALQLQDAGFDRILLMPNHIPPHRPNPGASSSQRLRMLQLAIEGLDGIEICDLELQRQESSYTVVTLEQLHQLYPQHRFTWVTGTDAWLGMDRWHRAASIPELANLLVITRPGQQPPMPTWQQQQLQQREVDLPALLQSPNGAICRHNWPGLDISASAIRHAIQSGNNIRFLVPDSVLEYLQQQQLYR